MRVVMVYQGFDSAVITSDTYLSEWLRQQLHRDRRWS